MKTFLNSTLGFLLAIVCVVSSSCANPQTHETKNAQPMEEIQDTDLIELTSEVMKSGLKALHGIFEKINEEVSEKSGVVPRQQRNIQWFELSTRKGVVKLHTYMPKDSVQMLMGRPHATSIRTYGDRVNETWRYEKRLYEDIYTTEFSFEFVNGELKSVDQY